jgi:selenocysteine lyase/cysteine desulfurase
MPVECQRHRFAIPVDHHYLNCAYMAPLSQRVERAGIEGVKRKSRPWEIVPDDFFRNVDRARTLFARIINADAARIALIPSVSYGIAAVAKNLEIKRGQNIVTLYHQYPANVYSWRRLAAEADATIRIVHPPADGARRGAGWNEDLLHSIDGDTGLVALAPVHWTDGTRFDLDAVGARAREVGAALVVDGTQAIGAAPFDVSHLRPDAVVCAAYKWLTGPYAIGLAYLGPRFDTGIPLEETWIGRKGSEDFNRLVDYQDEYRPGAARYDAGESSNFILTPMLVEALEQVLEWGVDNIAAYCRALSAPLLRDVEELGFVIEEEQWRSAHFFGLRLPSTMNVSDLRAALHESRVFVSARGGLLRVSPHVYNTEDDIAALRDALRS